MSFNNFEKDLTNEVKNIIETDYEKTITNIKDVCKKINITFSKEGDGRIESAIKEKDYLNKLKEQLIQIEPKIMIEIPAERYWYDIRINGIAINLKLSNCKTADNAFNKQAIIFTLTGSENKKSNMNYNEWFKIIKDGKIKMARNKYSEYHYLVINKIDGKILFKSIIDIHTYKPNPCNIMQINWSNEFDNIDYKVGNDEYKNKIIELLNTVQSSLKKSYQSMQSFIEADINKLF